MCHPAILLLLTGLTTLLTCTPLAAQKDSASQLSLDAAPRYTKLTDVPERVRMELEAFGRLFEADLLARDVSRIQAAFNLPGFMDESLEGFNVSASKRLELRSGMEPRFQSRFESISRNWAESEAKYKGLILYKGRIWLRFRLVFEQNARVSLVDLLVTPGPNGKLGISDIFLHTAGFSIAEETRQMALPFILALDKGDTDQIPDAVLKESEKLAEMVNLIKSNDLPGAVSAYHRLSSEMKNQRGPTLLHLVVLRKMPDVESYRTALKEAAKVHQAPSFQFMLLDLYLLEKDYVKAGECVDTLMSLTEKDAVLLATKALFQMHGGSTEAARKTMLEALALEPDCVSVHDRAINVLREAKDYKALSDSMRFMEKKTTYQFKSELSDPKWADFLKSPESAPWR